MDYKKMTIMFSLFGDFKSMMDLKSDEFDKAFSEYKKEVVPERFTNQTTGSFWKFAAANMVLAVHVNRIDFQYAYQDNMYTTEEKFMNACVNAFYQIEEIYPTIAGNRIALNSSGFIIDPEKDEMDKLSRALGFADLFEQDVMELQFRVNLATQINDEIFNSVVMVQDGQAKNNQTKSVTKALVINNDINTSIKNTTYRFKAKDIENYIANMVFEAETRKQQIFSKVE